MSNRVKAVAFVAILTFNIAIAGCGAGTESSLQTREGALDEWADAIVDDYAEQTALVAAPYEPPPADFLVIVQDDVRRVALQDFAAWKNSLGHQVEIVTLPEILPNHAGFDNAAKINAFLRSRFLGSGTLKYVMLVGDIDVIPMRLFYPDNKGWPYGTDHYYARPSVIDRDLDNDDQWGEFGDDKFDARTEIHVGRLPFNSVTQIKAFADNVIKFEKDGGGWKQNVLLPHGDFDPLTPGFEVGESMKADLLAPLGFRADTMGERSGISKPATPAAATKTLSRSAVTNALKTRKYGLINIVGHGATWGMDSIYWKADKNNDGLITENEEGRTDMVDYASIADAGAINSIVMLSGCNTGVPFAGDSPYAPLPAGSSRTLLTTPGNHISKAFLRAGAVAVIGATAGADFEHAWTSASSGKMQSLSYFFVEELVKGRMSVGAAFDNAQARYANKFGLARGIQVFYLMGDPSVRLDGFQNKPDKPDTRVHVGDVYGYAADSSKDGNMYAAVLASALDEPGLIKVMTSTDHGHTWTRSAPSGTPHRSSPSTSW